MSFLDDMEKHQKEQTALKHPLCDEDLRLREAYATGIALLLGRADEHLSEEEVKYLKVLTAALSLSDDPVERIVGIVKDADQEITKSIVSAIQRYEHKYFFIHDLYLAASEKGEILPEEKKMIDIFVKLLKLKQIHIDLLRDTYGFSIKLGSDLMYPAIQCDLGTMFLAGEIDENVNYLEAARWYGKAAELEVADAQIALAQMYCRGNIDGTYNYIDGYKWAIKAAEQGNATAQCLIGAYNEHGYLDGEQNIEAASTWYRKAAEQGDTVAQSKLDKLSGLIGQPFS